MADNLSILGCTDPTACNYDPDALEDNGSCLAFNECGGCEGEELFCIGCTDVDACNFSEVATIDDGSCFEIEAPVAQTAIQGTEPTTFTGEGGTHWFETGTSEDPLFIGDAYTLPVSTEDQSIWVAQSNGEYGMTGGKAEPDFNNGQHHPNNNYWLLFDVHQDAILESVDVYSLEGGGQSIEILDGSGAVISTTFQLLDPGLNVFLLNVELPTGTGYGIRSGNDQPLLWREDNNADVNYPYDIGNIASITSTTINGDNQYTYYYFYYNWQMSSLNPCLSPRVEFTVEVEDVNGLGEAQPDVAPRTLVKTMDVTGREVQNPAYQMVFRLYSDGTTEKAIVGDRE